jgi:hypothetical protein
VDIDEFYEADPRRRASGEIELGTEWHDAHDVRYELNYVADTGELYVMQEPPAEGREDPFGGFHVKLRPGYEDKLVVRVVAQIDSVDLVHSILEGWQDVIAGPDSIAWVSQRLRAAGVAVSPS